METNANANKAASSPASVQMMDIEQIVKDYAAEFLDPGQRKVADTKNPTITWDRMHVFYGDTVYNAASTPPSPKAHVLFSANFANNTPKSQTYTLRTERRTKSNSTLTFTKAFTFGASVQVKLGPPNPVIEANAGFKAERTKTEGATQTYGQEMSWAVDNEIEVPAGYQTKAELLFYEENYDGTFYVDATFEGVVIVSFLHKKSGKHVHTVRETVARLFGSQPGFQKDDKGRPVYRVHGTCTCKFGAKQDVKLTESKILPESEESDADQK